MKKATYKVSSDIALVKYWGKKDELLRLPENGSIAISLEGLDTVTTVEFDESLKQDEVIIEGNQSQKESKRVVKHLNRIRKLAKEKGVAGADLFAKVTSENTFPRGTGLSSSASGLAALTLAATDALGMQLSQQELSILARQGSGSACRCVCGGFVEWKDGDTSETSYSETIFPADHWDIRDVVVVVDEGIKKISSTQGHTTAQTSPFFKVRQSHIKQKLALVKELLQKKDFPALGKVVEAECLEFHSILLTSDPALVLWYPGTLQVINEIEKMRTDGIEAYYTINTGFNMHVLTLPEFEETVRKRIDGLSLVKKTLTAKVGKGPVCLT